MENIIEERSSKDDKKLDKKLVLFMISVSLYVIILIVFFYLFFKKMIIDKDITQRNIITAFTLFVCILFIRLFVIRKTLKNIEMKNKNLRGISILRFEILEKEIKAGDDIFSDGIEITNPNNEGIFNVHIELDIFSELLKLIIYKRLNSKIIAEEYKEIKNNSDFEIFVKPGELLNMKLDNTGIIKKLTVTETYLP